MKKIKIMIDFAKTLARCIPKWIHSIDISKNELNICIYPEYILPFFQYIKLHTHTQYKVLIDITAVDYPSKGLERFEVVYNLLSIQYTTRIRIKTYTNELQPISSIISIYSAAGWYERETWDMFGIYFSNHPDLRRILTDYGFEGHPLRKDFPLSGYTEVRYDDSEKRVITTELSLAQDFRYFDFSSPWELIQKK